MIFIGINGREWSLVLGKVRLSSCYGLNGGGESWEREVIRLRVYYLIYLVYCKLISW